MDGHRRKHRWNSRLYVLLLFGPLILAGCLTQKKREDITHRYLRENPKTLADLAAIHFPISPRPGIPVYIPGKPVIEFRTDTLISMDTVYIRDRETVRIIDTLRIVDTIPDNARIESLLLALNEKDREVIREQAQHENTKERSTQRLYWLIGAITALAGTLGVALFRLIKPSL